MTDLGGQVPAVQADERLWRRVPPDRVKDSPTEPGRPAPQGNAFRGKKDEDEGISVDRAAIHLARGDGPQVVLSGLDDRWGVLELGVQDCKDKELDVVPDPLPGNDAHALVKPKPGGGKSSALTAAAQWVVEPRWPSD